MFDTFAGPIMPLYPTFDEFRALARTYTLVPVYRELLFDVDTAVSAYHKLVRPPFGFLLESVVGGETWARYTFLGTEPRAAWRLTGRRIDSWTPAKGWVEDSEVADPLAELNRLLTAHNPAVLPGLPRFWGGAVGFFGYDIIRLIERLPDSPPDRLGLPDALLMMTGAVVAIDNLFGRAQIIVGVDTRDASDADLRRRYDDAMAEIDVLTERLRSEPGPPPLNLPGTPKDDPDFASTSTRDEYEANVRRIQDYIAAGDAFQVVLSAASQRPAECSGIRSLSSASYAQSFALPVLPRSRRIPAGWIITGSAGPGRGRYRRSAADRRNSPTGLYRLRGCRAV